jgi:riboflavin-specific deaminase-like protein
MKKSIPQVTLKFAQTLDGRIATVTGDSMWISSPESRRFAHKLRSQHDAVLVGVNTVLKDNPRLDVRLVKGKNPLKVIVDSRLRTPLSANVLKRQAYKTIFAVTKKANLSKIRQVEKLGARVIIVPADRNGQVDLKGLLSRLKKLGIKRLLVEGGAKIITSFLKMGLVNRVIVITAPKVIGRGLAALQTPLATRNIRLRLKQPLIFQLNQDLIIEGILNTSR